MIALYVLAGLIFLAFIVGGYVFFAACGRKDIDWLNEEEANKSPFGKFYTAVKMGHAWLQSNGARDIYTLSHDGLRLHASWVPAENAKGTVILIHGYHSCALTDFSIALPLYHEMGYNLLLPSQRAHGKSEGRFITFGVRESRDMQKWVEFHNANFGAFPIVCSGLSMGASTVMYLADEPLPENVKGFIADCGFSSPKEIISRVFRNVTHLPPWTVMWATNLFAKAFAGFHLDEKNTLRSLAKNTRPILLVHGAEDDFVPCEMTRRGFDACAGEKRLLIVEGATHGISFLKDKETYIAMVMELMEKCMENHA